MRQMSVSMAAVFHSLLVLLFLLLIMNTGLSQDLQKGAGLDSKVKKFLDSRAGRWHDLNVPSSDGKLLYDLIIKGKYTRALEIGTSTGHSGIWIAWALSQTGGKLITIEIDEERHKQALANFKQAGLSDYIDARLADAHDLVKKLEGPFDFVFSDADKEWYTQYFIDVAPKLLVGGCFAAHNVSGRRGGYNGIREYAEYVTSLKNFETTFNTSGAGVAISYKKSDQ
jgi:predicted O-methyltransferase YrrM